MAKFFGKIGFADTTEVSPGIWKGIVEREYYGDMSEIYGGWQEAESTNDDISIRKTISIVADPYAYNHFSTIRYVCFGGACWTVSNIRVEYPRLTLTVGGLYNGETAEED